MDLLSETQSGCVKIKHHSTSSTVEVIILSNEEKTQGGEMEETKQSIFLDYTEFEDLSNAIYQITLQ